MKILEFLAYCLFVAGALLAPYKVIKEQALISRNCLRVIKSYFLPFYLMLLGIGLKVFFF